MPRGTAPDFDTPDGHEIKLSFSRNLAGLHALAEELGTQASVGTPEDAVRFGEVVVIAVPWSELPNALEQAGSLAGRIVNRHDQPVRRSAAPAGGRDGGALQRRADARRPVHEVVQRAHRGIPGQSGAPIRATASRAVAVRGRSGAKQIVSKLIVEAGFVPVDLGGAADCWVMEAPRRPGAVYGEEYQLEDAMAVVRALRENRPIPPTPQYETVGAVT